MNTVGVRVRVREIRVQDAGQFCVIYVAKFAEAIYVLHIFQKKTPQTSKRDIDLGTHRIQQGSSKIDQNGYEPISVRSQPRSEYSFCATRHVDTGGTCRRKSG